MKGNGPNEKRNDLFAKGNGPNEKFIAKNVEFCDEKLNQFRRKLLPNKEKCVNIKNEN